MPVQQRCSRERSGKPQHRKMYQNFIFISAIYPHFTHFFVFIKFYKERKLGIIIYRTSAHCSWSKTSTFKDFWPLEVSRHCWPISEPVCMKSHHSIISTTISMFSNSTIHSTYTSSWTSFIISSNSF